ncbi:MAG: hypothetical protein JWM05_526 [Acidimicrobiales bacterium]|nr:hypothetical protein [Acidimicrobiales bacterium]
MDTLEDAPPAPPAASPLDVRRRRLAATVAVLLLVAVLAVVATKARHHGAKAPTGPPCRVAIGSESYGLDRDQADNATIITAVGQQMGLPHHAVTVALAAALQESQLHNLNYGDRDSLGLFQQRPSQGWGTRDQILKPDYAARAFYLGLQRVSGWSTLPVTTAAQRVQRSAAPDAYSRWEPEARVLARVLTREVPNRITCRPA